jgi:transposase-like protein
MKFTDKQRKNIIADYIECQNYTAVARKYGVSGNAVKKIVLSDEAFAEKCSLKKAANAVEIFQYMDTRKQSVCDLIDLYLTALIAPDKIEKATVNQLSTALGTVIDKFTMKGISDNADEEKPLSLADMIIAAYNRNLEEEEACPTCGNEHPHWKE